MDLPAVEQAFQRDGFVVLRGFLSSEELLGFRSALQKLELHKGFRQGSPAGVRKGLEKIEPWFENQLERGRHLALVEKLIASKPCPSSAATFSKPNKEQIIAPHSDGGGRWDGATIWLALDAADKQNGCLHYLAGSHTRAYTEKELQEINEHSEGVIAVEAQPGDAILHSARVVHFSGQSKDPTSIRRAVSMFYWTQESGADFDRFIREQHGSKPVPSRL